MYEKVAILVPCYNEAITIGKVIDDAKRQLPGAKIYVYDNNSTDDTVKIAKEHGAIVGYENNQGKGFVVKRMFSDIDAEYYILIDGDDTYDLSKATILLTELIDKNLDMVVGTRKPVHDKSYPMGHVLGNKMFNLIVASLFGKKFTDIFSGYRVFSKRYVKSFPCISEGFEIETEMSVHALDLNLAASEIELEYFSRPDGSDSKLNTFKDGFKILFAIVKFVKDLKPLLFYGVICVFFALLSVLLFVPILTEYLATGLVPRQPTLLLVTVLMMVGIMSMFLGVVLNSVSKTRKHLNWLMYLAKE